MQEDITLVQAKAVLGIDEHGDGFGTPLETAVDFGTRYRASGLGRGLTALSYAAELYPDVTGRDRRRAMFAGVREVSDDLVGDLERALETGLT